MGSSDIVCSNKCSDSYCRWVITVGEANSDEVVRSIISNNNHRSNKASFMVVVIFSELVGVLPISVCLV